MDLGLEGKAILVTGGNRGLGRQIALSFAEEGARVAICGRDAAKLEQTHGEIRSYGVEALALVADLFQGPECLRVVEEAVTFFGRLDILVNNASTNVVGTALTASEDQLMERILGKTLAAMRCSRAAVPRMRSAGGGRIICIGGTSARVSTGSAPQGLGNSALVNFAKHLSDEVARDHILVNVVHPSFCKTDRFPARLQARATERGISLEEAEATFASEVPIGRIVEPTDIAPLVLFLASYRASAITGQSVAVDGGSTRAIVY